MKIWSARSSPMRVLTVSAFGSPRKSAGVAQGSPRATAEFFNGINPKAEHSVRQSERRYWRINLDRVLRPK